MDTVNIGAFWQTLRKQRGWTQEQLGAKLAVSGKMLDRPAVNGVGSILAVMAAAFLRNRMDDYVEHHCYDESTKSEKRPRQSTHSAQGRYVHPMLTFSGACRT